MDRPNLDNIDEDVYAYIEYLERQLLAGGSRSQSESRPTVEPSEPETTINIITVSADGNAKRTPRHLYTRQRRSGMGVFDIETPEEQPPTILCEVDVNDDVLIITEEGRIFRIPVAKIMETDGRGRGAPLGDLIQLNHAERIVALLPTDAGLYINLISERGRVRHVRKTYLSPTMTQGIRYHNVSEGGYVTGACWSNGGDDLFIATRKGLGIRFSEKQVPNTGVLGMRVDPDDMAIAIAATDEDGGVLVVGHDGKGSIRLMAGFRKNKSPGAGGKVVLKTDRLVGVQSAASGDDVFIISAFAKLIRFSADEIPMKEGVVQGVNCMTLRADTVTAVMVSRAVNRES
jgi:DNA gyrase subunit A